MKKTLVTLLAAGAVAASSYGQGTVGFLNTAASIVQVQTSSLNPAPISVPTTVTSGAHVQLLWAPVGTTDLNLFSAATTLVTVNTTANGITDFHTAPGRFTAGVATVGTALPGGAVALVLRGWTGGFADWTAAQGAVAAGTAASGYSAIWTLNATGNPLTTPPGTAATLTSPSFLLSYAAVPEPTSMALAGIGAASLLIFRRRNK